MSLTPIEQIESPTYFFNARELARLAVYRAAVIARFYTDQCELTSPRHGLDSVRLFELARAEQQAA
jgi:hypothetical protein